MGETRPMVKAWTLIGGSVTKCAEKLVARSSCKGDKSRPKQHVNDLWKKNDSLLELQRNRV